MPIAAPVSQPAPVKPVVVVEPPKEKYVLMLERIVKGSDTDVKSDALSADDKSAVSKLKESVDQVKTDKKISI